jgi:tagatose-6-phosphate ketose/aldose isomerase
MNKLNQILNMSDAEKAEKGLEFTPREIAQQPSSWPKTIEVLKREKKQLQSFLGEILDDPRCRIVLSGAGTSEFIGNGCEAYLRRSLNVDVDSRATTDIVSNSEDIFISDRRYLVISFARSGNSPESIGTWNIANELEGAKQIVITCNADGELSKIAGKDKASVVLILPEETNDQSLVMTSSYSNMMIAAIGLARLDDLDAFAEDMTLASSAGNRILSQVDSIADFAGRPWKRAVFLGSGQFRGVAREGHLKMLESTDGTVMTRFDSFLALRHGPQVSVDRDSFIVAMLSDDPFTRQYELDLLKELKTQGKYGALLAITRVSDESLNGLADVIIDLQDSDDPVIPMELRAATDAIVCQLTGMFCSMALGLKPDAPSLDGTINRVVKGVKVYDHKQYRETQRFVVIAE